MLHILWMLLKLILILLGIALGLILLVLLLVLFCPVRYGAAAVKDCEDYKKIKAKVSVSWLFHGIWVRFFLENGAFRHDIRVFGIPISGWINKKKAEKQKASGTKGDGKREKVTGKKETPAIEEQISVLENAGTETDAADKKSTESAEEERIPVEESASESTEEKAVPEEEAVEPTAKREEQDSISGFARFRNKISGIWEKLVGIPKKISEAIRKLSLTIKNIYAKIDWWKQFLSHPKVKEAISFVKREIWKLIRHIFPTRIWGNLTFGSEDPATTGTVLAILGITMPFHKNCIEVNPVFDGTNRIEGNVQLKGRVYGIVLVKTAIEIYFNKNVKYIISRWKHKEG